MKKVLLAGLAALSLAACATATPYQPNVRGADGGFSEYRVAADRFRVTFAGNSLTSRETVEAYLLYRAAELTVQNGGDWFTTLDQDTERQTRTYAVPSPYFGPGYGYGAYGAGLGYGYPFGGFWSPRWRYYGGGYGWRNWDPFFGDPFFGGTDYRTVSKYEATADIVIGRGPKPAGDRRAVDAREVLANLAGRIQRPV